MRSAQELEAELMRTRRRLYRLTGWMALAFIACLALVFVAIGGALVVVDKRATNMLDPDATRATGCRSMGNHPRTTFSGVDST